MNRNFIAMCLCLVAVAVVSVFIPSDRVSFAAESSGSDALVGELKALHKEVKSLNVKVASIEEKQASIEALNKALLSSKWEYKVASIHGGSIRENLEKLLAEMGEKKFEYVDLTDDGLYIFRRRIVEVDE